MSEKISEFELYQRLAKADYYEAVRQRIPWIETRIKESELVVEGYRRSNRYIETTVRLIQEIWGPDFLGTEKSDASR